jgi:hypothetical protein
MVGGQLHAPAALPSGRSPRYQVDRRLGGPQSRSGRGDGEKKNPVIAPVGKWTTVVQTPHHDRQLSQYESLMFRKFMTIAVQVQGDCPSYLQVLPSSCACYKVGIFPFRILHDVLKFV